MSIKVLKRCVKQGIRCLLFVAGICFGLFLLSSCIPTSRIEQSVEESCDYFMREALFKQWKSGHKSTTYDNYADCMLVNMLYMLDTNEPFISVLKAEYACEEGENISVALKKAVSLTENSISTRSYARYWHGSMVLLRPLFLFGDICMVRWVLGAFTMVIFLYNLLLLSRRGMKNIALYYLITFVMMQGIVMFFCVNYILNFLLVNLTLWMILKGKVNTDEGFYCLMVTVGAITCFLDFLTTETVTLTLPLLVYLFGGYREHKWNGETNGMPKCVTVVSVIGWGFGYAGMFGLKWLLVYLFLGKETLFESLQQATMRIQDGNGIQALVNNIAAIFNLNEFQFQQYKGLVTIVFSLIALILLGVLMRQPNQCIHMLVWVSLVPYLRYALIRNHSQIHYFFTYRAQMTTLMVLMIGIEMIVRKWKNI